MRRHLLFLLPLPCLPVAADGGGFGGRHASKCKYENVSLGQADRVDVGSFTLFMKNQRSGREQFSIRRVSVGDGVALELRSESAIGDFRSAVRLEVDSLGSPVRYSLEERSGAEVSLRLGGQRVRGRFATLARGPLGEAAREFLLVPGALVMEDDGIVQYALVVRRAVQRAQRAKDGTFQDTARVATLTPSGNRTGSIRLVSVSIADTIVIAGARRAAARWRVLTDGGDVRDIWADAEGRLLRVRIPARGLDAVRDDIPRDVPR